MIAGAVAAIDDDLARGRIHIAVSTPGRAASNGRGLRAVDEVEDRLHLVGGFAQHKGAGDVGSVALHCAAVVEHQDAALAQGLRLARAVRQGGELVDVEAGLALESNALVSGGDERCTSAVVMPGCSDWATAR